MVAFLDVRLPGLVVVFADGACTRQRPWQQREDEQTGQGGLDCLHDGSPGVGWTGHLNRPAAVLSALVHAPQNTHIKIGFNNFLLIF